MKLEITCRRAGAGVRFAGRTGRHRTAWSLEGPPNPMPGPNWRSLFLDRPGYNAAIKMLPNSRRPPASGQLHHRPPMRTRLANRCATSWPGRSGHCADRSGLDQAASPKTTGWCRRTFIKTRRWPIPTLICQFLPLVLDAFGSWNGVNYGLPFDNYSGLLFYNRCMLEAAGFKNPPATWQEVMDTYGPALTKDGKYAYALQSKRKQKPSRPTVSRVSCGRLAAAS